MRVLVTGSTGFLGGGLVRRLIAGGDSVRILARDRAKAEPLAALGAEVFVGDITNRDALLSALDDVEVVYHLAGRLFVPGVREEEYHRTHVEGTRTLLSCCEERPTLRRFVHCSTTGVLGVTGDRPSGEDAPIAPSNAYERTKWQAEQLVRGAAGRGMPVAIVRPGLVYGPGDLHLLGFFQSIQRHLFRPIGYRPVWLHPVYVDDLVDAIVLCANHPGAIGECFNVAGQQPVTILTLASVIAESLGVSRPSGVIPLAAARPLALVGDMLPVRLRALAPLTQSRLDFLTHSRVYDVAKAERLLGFVAETDLANGIAQTVAWYRQRGYLPPTPSRARLKLKGWSTSG